MQLLQDRVVLAAHAAAESAWIFALAGVIGVIAGLDASPQSWYAIIGILAMSILIGHMTPRSGEKAKVLYPFLAAAAGLLVMYASVALQVQPGQTRPAWPIEWIANDLQHGYAQRALLGSILCIALWWRGIRLSSNEFPTDNLALTFRIGMIVIVCALIYDLNTPERLYTFPMVFLFFGSALAGLSAGRLLPEAERSTLVRTWPKTIGATVAAITTLGLIVALIDRGALSLLSTPALTALEALARGIIWGIIAPIAFLFETVFGWIASIFDFTQAPAQPQQAPEFTSEMREMLEELQREQEPSSDILAAVIQIIEWALISIVALASAAILIRAFKRLLHGHEAGNRGRRDSIAPNIDPLNDAATLALRLVPNVLKRPKTKKYRVPDGPPGIAEAFRLYYDMLDAAHRRGIVRPPHHTPTEFQPTLERTLPPDVVRPSTHAFNLAIYAHTPAEQSRIRRLRASMKAALASTPRNTDDQTDGDDR